METGYDHGREVGEAIPPMVLIRESRNAPSRPHRRNLRKETTKASNRIDGDGSRIVCTGF